MEKMTGLDSFVGEIITVGNSLAITLPSRNVKFSGLKKGQMVKIVYKVVG